MDYIPYTIVVYVVRSIYKDQLGIFFMKSPLSLREIAHEVNSPLSTFSGRLPASGTPEAGEIGEV